jgi:hypothetical protein
MFYEIAQSALTVATEVIAIAGIGGIIAHALYTQHKQFMTEFCPPVAPATDSQAYIDSLEDDGLTGEYGVEVIEDSVEETVEVPDVTTALMDSQAVVATNAPRKLTKTAIAKMRRGDLEIELPFWGLNPDSYSTVKAMQQALKKAAL